MVDLEKYVGRIQVDIVDREYDKSSQPMMITLKLSCGHEVVRPAPRVPKATWMYCDDCRAGKKPKAKKKGS